jgi:hypothetical protein
MGSGLDRNQCVFAKENSYSEMRLPTAREINPAAEDLDGKWAEKHFLGKSLEEAEALFREDSLRLDFGSTCRLRSVISRATLRAVMRTGCFP